MGLSIHYNGRFSNSASLLEMIEELKDVAEINNWKYQIFHSKFPEKLYDDDSHSKRLYGIIIFIPNCEPLYMTFLSNRRMCMPVALKFWGNSTDEIEKKYLYMLSTKTQFAGRNIHKIVIRLFKYLSKKYLSEFELLDEGKYWETGDEKILDDNFAKNEEIFNSIGLALESIPLNENESIEEYLERILKIISKKHEK